MLFSNFASSMALASLVAAGSIENTPWAQRRAAMPEIPTSQFERRANGTGGGDAVLSANNIQTGSQRNGLANPNADAGTAPSNTDNANFINFCQDQDLTNGLQKEGGSCNGIVMGKIPSQDKMTSSIITFPKPGQDLSENEDFNVQLSVANLQAGTFTEPDVTYYAAPQDLNDDGTIIGHTHVTIQDMGGSLTPTEPLDALKTAFFLGIDDDGDGQGNLQAAVTGGLAAGSYRVCTMASSSNHQPVLMPIAQRGAQDDCTKFTVGAGGGGNATKRAVPPSYLTAPQDAATKRAQLYDRTKRFASRNWVA